MPSRSQHLQKADRNRQLLATLDRDQFAEWAATVAFYAALHLVEAVLATDGRHGRDHTERLEIVRAEFAPIFYPFRELYHASQLARYHSTGDFFANFSNDAVRDGLIGRHLPAVVQYVEARLA